MKRTKRSKRVTGILTLLFTAASCCLTPALTYAADNVSGEVYDYSDIDSSKIVMVDPGAPYEPVQFTAAVLSGDDGNQGDPEDPKDPKAPVDSEDLKAVYGDVKDPYDPYDLYDPYNPYDSYNLYDPYDPYNLYDPYDPYNPYEPYEPYDPVPMPTPPVEPTPTPTEEPTPTEKPQVTPAEEPETTPAETNTESHVAEPVRTADDTNPTLWFGLLFATGCAGLGCMYTKKRREEKK